MRKLSFVLVGFLLSVSVAFGQLDPWQFTLSENGVTPGITYGSVAPSIATIGRPPAPGEVWVDTNGAPDGGAAMFIYNATAAAFQSAGSSLGVGEVITFEGATADAFQTILSVVDPTVGTGTFLLPNNAAAAANYALTFSTLATNALDAANSVWFGTNQIVMESTVADAFQYTIQPAVLTGSVAVTLPSDNADWAGTASPMYSVLLTNAPDIANGVWGVANGIHFEGATADAWENSLQSDDPTVADGVFNLPNNAAAGPYKVAFSDLATNTIGGVDAVWLSTSAAIFEGATADAFETSIVAQDPDVDVNFQLPNKSVTGDFNVLDSGQAPAFGAEVMDREDSVSVAGPARYKAWFRTMPVFTMGTPTTAGGVAACSTTVVNHITGPAIVGMGFELDPKGTQTVCGNDYVAADGMGLHNDATDDEGWELTQGTVDGSPGAFTIGTSPAFYMRVRWAIATVANTDQCYAGFRLAEAYQNVDIADYNDYYVIGVGDVADGGAGDWYRRSLLNGAGAVNTDIAEADWTNNQVHTVEIQVSAAGLVTALIEGAVVADAGAAFTFDDTDIVVPMLFCVGDVTGADVDVDVVFWESGIQ